MKKNIATIVTALARPLRRPATAMESLVLATLTSDGALPLESLVDRVAGELFREELRHGGWAADIGTVGRALFWPDVRRVVDEASGILWTLDGAIAAERGVSA